MFEGALISRPAVSRHGIFFWLLRTFVRVRYTFFLAALLLGARRQSPLLLLEWVFVLFAAILVHELGHALAARRFRQNPQIELNAMGGLTHWAWRDEIRWSERVVTSLAGPAAGFLLGGAVYVAGTLVPPSEPYLLRVARLDLLWISVVWGVFNLLPILPLDGGQVLSEVLTRRYGAPRGILRARQVSCVAGFIGLVVGILTNELWAGLLCGVFAFDNLQRIRGLPGVALPR